MKKFLQHSRTKIRLPLLAVCLALCLTFSTKPPLFRAAYDISSPFELAGATGNDSTNNPNNIPSGLDGQNDPNNHDNPDNPDNPDPDHNPLAPEGSDLPASPQEPADSWKFSSDLIFQAINPGYTIDGTRDVGEFILLRKLTDTSLSLAGYSVRYVNSSGTGTTLLNFSEGTLMTGETLLMRLARSPDSNLSDATYTTTLAISSGHLELLYGDITIDSVCWSTGTDCSSAFKSSDPTSLVRNLQTGQFTHESDYLPNFDPDSPALILPPPESSDNPNDQPLDSSDETSPSASCKGLEFSEIYTYYSDSSSEQFVELYNSTDEPISLTFCTLRYKNKTYPLSGQIPADSYYAYYPSKSEPQFTFTKNPSSSNSVELLDYDKTPVDILTYSHGQKKSTAYARFHDSVGDELWQQTYSPTPGAANNYQEFRTCPAGKVINPATGNCIKSSSPNSTATADCPAGKYRNPLTGRCKNIESATTEAKPCAEGYERNPETGRCRKKQGINDGAGYALVPNTSTSSTHFVATGIIILLISCGSLYIIFQFRREIARATRKVRQRLHGITKNLFSRRIRFHRHKKP